MPKLALKPLSQGAVWLIPDPTPGELHHEATDMLVAGARDALIVCALATLIRAGTRPTKPASCRRFLICRHPKISVANVQVPIGPIPRSVDKASTCRPTVVCGFAVSAARSASSSSRVRSRT